MLIQFTYFMLKLQLRSMIQQDFNSLDLIRQARLHQRGSAELHHFQGHVDAFA